MEELSPELQQKFKRLAREGSVPCHIAFIMDGNRRWAENNNLSLEDGHREGSETARKIARVCREIEGLEYLTFYAFSTENWSRPDSEVNTLFDLLDQFLQEQLPRLHEQEVQFNCIGNIEELPDFLRNRLARARDKTRGNRGLTINMALNYGGRDELVRAVKKIAYGVETGEIEAGQIDEELIDSFLDTAGMPAPDLLIRTSGEKRLSNFLLWQLAYTELYFTERLWPEFEEPDLLEAISDYQGRTRRYGARLRSETTR